MRKYMVLRAFVITILLVNAFPGRSQTTYPGLAVNQSYTPPSPNAQGFQSYNNDPVALYTGLPSIGIPIYTVKCGTLSVPINLTYNSNGFFPLQDAGWVGLGWTLSAGGVISRIVEGDADGTLNSGHNFGQISLADSLNFPFHMSVDSFLQKAYNMNLAYGNNTYDMAPDIFNAQFNGIGGQFYWINGKAYMLSYDKQLSISWPSYSSNIVITTEDGTQYTFGAIETTTDNYYGGSDSTSQSFPSSWFLTQMVSVQGDTIDFNYAPYTWQQTLISYQCSYTLNLHNGSPDLGYDPNKYEVEPSLTTQVLQSIVCRNSRVSFIPDATGRTDINGTLPRLREIVVIDSLTGDTVKKDFLSYKYFGLSTVNPKLYERLALKTFSSVNTLVSSDSLTYTFKYINESDTAINGSGVGFPPKNTLGTDYWGYYNGAGNSVSLPNPTSIYYSTPPPPGASFSPGVDRDPDSILSEYGQLDTIVYPTSGYTAFQYQQNVYQIPYVGHHGDTTVAGPGLRLQSTTMFDGINPNPVLQKNYTYLENNGDSTSGLLANIPNYNGPSTFVATVYTFMPTDTTTNVYSQYAASNPNGGVGGTDPIMYYTKVTESVTSNGETHKSDHYYTQFPPWNMPNIRETMRIDYVNTVNTNIFTPVSKTVSNYNYTLDTTIDFYVPYIDSENYSIHNLPKTWYAFNYTFNQFYTYWVFPTSQQTTKYDVNGDSLATTTNYYFNNATRNLAYTETQGSDGQTLVKKFKYPEDYTSGITGNMVSSHVVGPVIEKETWLKQNSSDSVLISGEIVEYDQTIFKPDTTYAIETSSPIASLSNQTTSGSLYSSLVCDAHYIRKGQLQYDANKNLNVATKANDAPVSYIWDYRHSNVIAEVTNAVQADIAYTSFEADGTGNWTFTGGSSASANSFTGNMCYNLGQASGNITKAGLTSSTTYVVSYWISTNSPLTITGTIAGYPIKGKTITVGATSWTYYEHKITGQTSVTLSGTGYLDEVRLYPANAQMTTYTYTPLVGVSTKCDAGNRATYYQYDAFGRLKVVLDQDRNIIRTIQYHTIGETVE
jgi:YD repeat-containing protein